MTCCPIYCSDCQDIYKTNQVKVQALNICCLSFISIIIKNFESESLLTSNSTDFFAKTGNCFYIIKILSYSKT